MADKQTLFTNAFYDYMNERHELENMALECEIDKNKIYYGYDIVLQLALLEMIVLDNTISSLEVEFISKIIDENDLMRLLSKKTGKKIGWSMLKNEENTKSFIHSVNAAFMMEMVQFISLFISKDHETKDDYLNTLKGNVYMICKKILEVDGFDSAENDAYKVLERTIFKKMDDLKNIAYKSANIKVGEVK